MKVCAAFFFNYKDHIIFPNLLFLHHNVLHKKGVLITLFPVAVCRIDAFLRSDQYRCASKLLSAYTEADIEEIKRIAQSSTISNLDHTVLL